MAERETAANAKALQKKIEECAYSIWEAEGKPHGCDTEHWLRAEAEVSASLAAGPKRNAQKQSAVSTARQKKAQTRKK